MSVWKTGECSTGEHTDYSLTRYNPGRIVFRQDHFAITPSAPCIPLGPPPPTAKCSLPDMWSLCSSECPHHSVLLPVYPHLLLWFPPHIRIYLFFFFFFKFSCLFFFFFFMWTILKIFIEFVTTLLLFYGLVFWPQKACGILTLDQGWNSHPCIGRQSLNHWTTQGSP